MAKLNIAPAPEPEAPAPVDPFAFTTMVFEELPELETKGNAKSAPWRGKFDELAPQVIQDGKARGFYVPLAYFVRERGVDAEKATHAYAKGKLGDAWKKWSDDNGEAASKLELAKGNRSGKEQGYEALGAGILVILKLRKVQ